MGIVVSSREYSVQDKRQEGPVFKVPVGSTGVRLSLTREHWAKTRGEAVRAQVDLSLDGGRTWRHWIGFHAPGGVIERDPGIKRTRRTKSRAWRALPEPRNPNRVVRVQLQTKTALRTKIEVEVY